MTDLTSPVADGEGGKVRRVAIRVVEGDGNAA